MTNISEEICRENQNTHFVFKTFFFENLAVYEIVKITVQPRRPLMTIWCMRSGCWIPNATDTHSEYIILIAFLLQQWLHERASMLRHSTWFVLLKFIYMTFRPQRENLHHTREADVPQMKMSWCQSFMPQKLEFLNRKPVWEVAAAAVPVVIYGPGIEWLKTGHGSTAVYPAVLTTLLRCEIESGLSDDLACRMPMCDGPATCGPDGHRFLTNYKIPQVTPSEPPSR